MIDIANVIYTYLSHTSPAYWTQSNPALADLTFRLDEFDLKNPNLQILLENLPDKKTFVRETLQRVEHQCQITIFVKPVVYDATTIAASKTKFLNMKTEIDRIINLYLFTISSHVELGGWDDDNTLQVGRGTKNFRVTENDLRSDAQEPIIFQSKQIVTCFYYIFSGTSDSTKVPIRVSKIDIGVDTGHKYEWIGITDAQFEDTDPWVNIEIPGGSMVHQHLHPAHVKGSIRIRDFNAMKTALFNTLVDGTHYAIGIDGTKWNIGYFVITIQTHNGTFTATFANAKIKVLQLGSAELNKDNSFTITFMADAVTYA